MVTVPRVGGERFFRIMAFVIFVLAVVGFASVAIRFPDHVPTFYPLLIVHALAMTGWLVLFVVQAQLVASRQRHLHIMLGASSIVLAVLVVVTGLAVTYGTYQPGRNEPIMVANTGMAVNFSLCYLIAMHYRSQPHIHKRLMLLAAIALMPTALSRIAISSGLGGIFGTLLFMAMLASVPVRDWFLMRDAPAAVRHSPVTRQAVRAGRLGAIGQFLIFVIATVVQITMSRLSAHAFG